MLAKKLLGVTIQEFVLWNPSVLNGGNFSASTCVLKNATAYCGSFYDSQL